MFKMQLRVARSGEKARIELILSAVGAIKFGFGAVHVGSRIVKSNAWRRTSLPACLRNSGTVAPSPLLLNVHANYICRQHIRSHK